MPKETVSTLREHVDGIVSRLKAADTHTRKSVKSLETAFSALEKQVQSHQNIDHAALSKQVEQLASHLTRTIDTTKKDIAADLKSAMETPTAGGLEAAIARSEQKLSETEMAQARALAKINKHIAEMARVIDARFRNQEGVTRNNEVKISELQDMMTSLQSQSYERIRVVENSTAEAIRKVGDEVVGTAETFQSRLESQNATLRERVEAIAARTQQDFDEQKTDLSRRMESIEDSQKNQSNYIDRSISKLAARIDSLEFGLTQSTEQIIADTMPVVATPPPIPKSNYISPEDNIVSIPAPESERPSPEVPADPATHPEPAADPYAVPEIYAAPTAPAPAPTAMAPQTDGGQLQEYSPQMDMGQTKAQHQYVDPAQAAYPPQTHLQSDGQSAYSYDPYQAEAPLAETAPQSYDYSQAVTQGQPIAYDPENPDFGGIADDELPFDNPGYGEAAADEGLSRPGHVKKLKKKPKRKKSGKSLLSSGALSNLPITPRNLRVAGLALAVAAVGYLGLRGVMGSGAPDQRPQLPVASQPGEVFEGNPQQAAITPSSQISTSEPIGSYKDNTAALPVANAAPGNQTLQQAADGGNAIAQYQLGVSYLDAGRTADGVKFIRAAANQGQPAAQYRLAKLYEAGIGVSVDPDMARQLTERAARSGNRIAMHDLGLYYAEGRGGVDRNLQTALSWFEKAAERGVVDSQYNLGILFGSTPEIPKDPVASFVWFSIAAAQGDQFAGNQLEALEAQLSADQLKQAKSRVAGFKPVSIDDASNGIFTKVPWSMPDARSFVPTANLVREAQTLLGSLGYNVGTPDGDMGPKTRAAVKAFEKANGLPETGVVSGSLIDRLEAAAGV